MIVEKERSRISTFALGATRRTTFSFPGHKELFRNTESICGLGKLFPPPGRGPQWTSKTLGFSGQSSKAKRLRSPRIGHRS